MTATFFLIGLAVMAGWAALCFGLAARHYRRSIARRTRPDRLYMRTMVAAGAGCAIMTFVLIFFTFNPPPASLDTMRP
jgi:hypothetical protein